MNSSKDLKSMFRELGFHHSWGYYIHNEQHNFRIQFNKKRIWIRSTDTFYATDAIDWRYMSFDSIKGMIMKYFGLKVQFKYGK